MKALVWVLVLLFVLGGCSDANIYDAPNVTESTKSVTSNTDMESTEAVTFNTDIVCYLIQENAENLISFPIPNTKSMSPEEMTFIQSIVQNRLLAMTGESMNLVASSEDVKDKDQIYDKYSILMESQITYESDNHISMVFNGLLNRRNSAHPIHWLFSINYNPQTLQIIPFSEKFTIDKQLYAVFADSAEKAIKEEFEGVLPPGWESFREMIPSEQIFLEGMKVETEYSYYLHENGVVVSYPVPFAFGNHKEVIIKTD